MNIRKLSVSVSILSTQRHSIECFLIIRITLSFDIPTWNVSRIPSTSLYATLVAVHETYYANIRTVMKMNKRLGEKLTWDQMRLKTLSIVVGCYGGCSRYMCIRVVYRVYIHIHVSTIKKKEKIGKKTHHHTCQHLEPLSSSSLFPACSHWWCCQCCDLLGVGGSFPKNIPWPICERNGGSYSLIYTVSIEYTKIKNNLTCDDISWAVLSYFRTPILSFEVD